MTTKKFFASAQIELNFYASQAEVQFINAKQIKEFRREYWAHTTTLTQIRDNMSPEFVQALSMDATIAKMNLRSMMRRSQYWNENIQAWVTPLVHKFEPNIKKVRQLIIDTWSASPAWDNLST